MKKLKSAEVMGLVQGHIANELRAGPESVPPSLLSTVLSAEGLIIYSGRNFQYLHYIIYKVKDHGVFLNEPYCFCPALIP